MKCLKSYGGAMLVTIAVVILSILFGSHRSLVAERAKVEAAFYPTAENSFSISTDLEDCTTIATNLLTVGERYLKEKELDALEDSRDALAEGNGVKAAHTAYRRLAEEAGRVLDQLDSVPLSEKDAGYVKGFRADLAARADTIARSEYNQKADDYNHKVLGTFPANLLRYVTFVRPAEVFR